MELLGSCTISGLSHEISPVEFGTDFSKGAWFSCCEPLVCKRCANLTKKRQLLLELLGSCTISGLSHEISLTLCGKFLSKLVRKKKHRHSCRENDGKCCCKLYALTPKLVTIVHGPSWLDWGPFLVNSWSPGGVQKSG